MLKYLVGLLVLIVTFLAGMCTYKHMMRQAIQPGFYYCDEDGCG